MKYTDYIDLTYTPYKNDIICKFYLEPLRLSLKETAGAVAAESSIGTWTEVKTEKQYVKKLAAKVFSIEQTNKKAAIIEIAYSSKLFEQGNIPNILSSIAGNIFGLEEIKNIRLLDINFPKSFIKSFQGPKYRIKGIREIMKIENRPLLGTIIKPKLGLNSEDHAKVAYVSWLGGCDLVKDDENLSNQNFNRFEVRLKKTLKMKDKAEKETGEKKAYIINVTAETKEMIKRVKLVENYCNEYVMIDVITSGFAALQTLRNLDLNLIIHAHRAGHAAVTKSKKHGISMKVIAKLCRFAGVDQLHVGAAFGKMFENKQEVGKNLKAIKEECGLKEVMPVASGGLSPKDVPNIINFFGRDVVIQMGGGIHGHIKGSLYGAKAAREAIESVISGIEIKEAQKHIKN